MKNFEQKSEKKPWVRPEAKYVYSEQIEEIALRAAEMKEFQDVVTRAKNRFEAIKTVRGLLPQYFSEIDETPQSKVEKQGLLPPASNEFKIAKHIVDLLYKK